MPSTSNTIEARMDALDSEFYRSAMACDSRKFFQWLKSSYGVNDLVQFIAQNEWRRPDGALRTDRMATLETFIRSLREFVPPNEADKAYEVVVTRIGKPDVVVDSAWFVRKDDACRWAGNRMNEDHNLRSVTKLVWIRANSTNSRIAPSDDNSDEPEGEPNDPDDAHDGPETIG